LPLHQLPLLGFSVESITLGVVGRRRQASGARQGRLLEIYSRCVLSPVNCWFVANITALRAPVCRNRRRPNALQLLCVQHRRAPPVCSPYSGGTQDLLRPPRAAQGSVRLAAAGAPATSA